MKPLYWRTVNSYDVGRPRLTHHPKGARSKVKWAMCLWKNGGIKFFVGENGRIPEKNLPRLRFVYHKQWPRRELVTTAVGSERLTAYAAQPSSLVHTLLHFEASKCYILCFCKNSINCNNQAPSRPSANFPLIKCTFLKNRWRYQFEILVEQFRAWWPLFIVRLKSWLPAS